MAEKVTSVEDNAVIGFLHEPVQAATDALVLTHGAGASATAPLLVAVASVFCAAGWAVLRCNLPFRQKRRFGPPHPAAAPQDREGLRAAVAFIRARVSGKVVLGGHSYGGRQSSILAAESPGLADALLLLSYPLHPPNKPEQLRTAHFHTLQTPALFVHGTKDPFASPDELRAALALIPAHTELIIVDGAGHDLARGKFDLDRLTSLV
jgi:predicted alpha/beta-hydrolase family hydrolase